MVIAFCEILLYNVLNSQNDKTHIFKRGYDMEFIEFIFEVMEFILELILEGSMEASKNRKVPRFIRCMLVIMISVFFLSVDGLILFAGILITKENKMAGIILILLGVFMFIMSIIKLKKLYWSIIN